MSTDEIANQAAIRPLIEATAEKLFFATCNLFPCADDTSVLNDRLAFVKAYKPIISQVIEAATGIRAKAFEEERLWAWHLRHYGPVVDVPATYRHLVEEVGELGEALMCDQPAQTREELADVLAVLVILSHGVGGQHSLGPALADKLAIIENRQASRSNRRLAAEEEAKAKKKD